MKVWLVIREQRDEKGNVCNYSIIDVCDTYIRANKKWKLWLHYWGKANRKILYDGKDVAVSVCKDNIRSVVYVEEREVK